MHLSHPRAGQQMKQRCLRRVKDGVRAAVPMQHLSNKQAEARTYRNRMCSTGSRWMVQDPKTDMLMDQEGTSEAAILWRFE